MKSDETFERRDYGSFGRKQTHKEVHVGDVRLISKTPLAGDYNNLQ